MRKTIEEIEKKSARDAEFARVLAEPGGDEQESQLHYLSSILLQCTIQICIRLEDIERRLPPEGRPWK